MKRLQKRKRPRSEDRGLCKLSRRRPRSHTVARVGSSAGEAGPVEAFGTQNTRLKVQRYISELGERRPLRKIVRSPKTGPRKAAATKATEKKKGREANWHDSAVEGHPRTAGPLEPCILAISSMESRMPESGECLIAAIPFQSHYAAARRHYRTARAVPGL